MLRRATCSKPVCGSCRRIRSKTAPRTRSYSGVLGTAFHNIGQPQRAEPPLKAAVDELLSSAVHRPDLAAKTLSDWAVVISNEDRNDEAIALARRALALRQSIEAPPLEMADSCNTLGLVLIDTDKRRPRKTSTSVGVASTACGRLAPSTAATVYTTSPCWLGTTATMPTASDVIATPWKSAMPLTRTSTQACSTRVGPVDLRANRAACRSRGLAAARAGAGATVIWPRQRGRRLGSELASTQHDMGDWPKARASYETAMRESAATGGENTVDYATKLTNLASLEEDSGALAAAERFPQIAGDPLGQPARQRHLDAAGQVQPRPDPAAAGLGGGGRRIDRTGHAGLGEALSARASQHARQPLAAGRVVAGQRPRGRGGGRARRDRQAPGHAQSAPHGLVVRPQCCGCPGRRCRCPGSARRRRALDAPAAHLDRIMSRPPSGGSPMPKRSASAGQVELAQSAIAAGRQRAEYAAGARGAAARAHRSTARTLVRQRAGAGGFAPMNPAAGDRTGAALQLQLLGERALRRGE